ncbi:hypothetical+protein [Methylocapsa aurea]|uniref:hypothetical protein n=1 Tax=Methylocapsa aurea TaxID=663610 RepID=UPI003D18A3E2
MSGLNETETKLAVLKQAHEQLQLHVLSHLRDSLRQDERPLVDRLRDELETRARDYAEHIDTLRAAIAKYLRPEVRGMAVIDGLSKEMRLRNEEFSSSRAREADLEDDLTASHANEKRLAERVAALEKASEPEPALAPPSAPEEERALARLYQRYCADLRAANAALALTVEQALDLAQRAISAGSPPADVEAGRDISA